jgi:hypothetical protein
MFVFFLSYLFILHSPFHSFFLLLLLHNILVFLNFSFLIPFILCFPPSLSIPILNTFLQSPSSFPSYLLPILFFPSSICQTFLSSFLSSLFFFHTITEICCRQLLFPSHTTFPSASPDWLQHLKFTDITDRHSSSVPSNKSHFKYFVKIITKEEYELELWLTFHAGIYR